MTEEDPNTPAKRSIRVLDALIREAEQRLEELKFIRRTLADPAYDDRYEKKMCNDLNRQLDAAYERTSLLPKWLTGRK